MDVALAVDILSSVEISPLHYINLPLILPTLYGHQHFPLLQLHNIRHLSQHPPLRILHQICHIHNLPSIFPLHFLQLSLPNIAIL